MTASQGVGAARVSEKIIPAKAYRLNRTDIKRKAGIAAVFLVVAGAATSSALFVDYLADRAKLRTATVKKAPEVVQAAATIELPKTAPQPTAAPVVAAKEMPAAITAADLQPRTDAEQTIAAAKVQIGSASAAIKAFAGVAGTAAETQDGDGPDLLAYAEGDADPHGDMYTSAIPEPRPEPAVAATGNVASVPEVREATARPARVKRAVNLRSRPADEGKVIGVVPAKASVNVLSCEGWCQVEYQGKKGFIYKSFINRS